MSVVFSRVSARQGHPSIVRSVGMLLCIAGGFLASLQPVGAAQFDPAPLAAKVAEIRERLSARVGVSVVDAKGQAIWSSDGDDRFPLNSTFKAFACAHLLALADEGSIDPDQSVQITRADLLSYSPVTEKRAGGNPMSLTELCAATLTFSDNTAANLLLRETGGPSALTDFLRGTGDEVTRLDRNEPDLNEAAPGDPRDTTTPNAAAETLARLVFGDVLSEGSINQLRNWLSGNRVSDGLLRKSLPADWKIGDRSGAGGHGSRSIVAVIWPPQAEPVVVAVYLTETDASFATRDAAIAEIGTSLVKAIGN